LLCCFTKCLNLPCSTVPWVGCSWIHTCV
jgi:hypothetical protein